MPTEAPSPAPELASWLAANRESLMRRWIELVVERSSLEELAARPMAERVLELDLLLEAARSQGGARSGAHPDVEEALAGAIADGGPVALALLAPPGEPEPADWLAAVTETARREERVAATSDGRVGVVLRAGDEAAARVAADRIRAGAWQLLGGASRLPEVAVAVHPGDGADAATLVAAALGRLPLAEPAPAEAVRGERRSGGTLRQELDRWAREERPGELVEEAAAQRPPAPVTPLYPETLD